jgi:hypothetical protein
MLPDVFEENLKFQGIPYQVVPMLKSDVDAVDYLLRISGIRSKVETSDDWVIIAKLFEFYTRKWPLEWDNFVKEIKKTRATRARKDGYSREHGKDGTRYLASVPLYLMKLIKIIFPEQQWDREFTDKFINNIKITRVGEKTDTWFTLPDVPEKRYNHVEEAVKNLKQNGTSTK